MLSCTVYRINVYNLFVFMVIIFLWIFKNVCSRYCLFYLRSMEKLPSPVLKDFLQGQHVMRHQPGLWNAIWSDMYIESTFMRYGHSPGGIIGITLKPSTLKRWALSLHLCSQIVKDVSEMKDESRKVSVTVHKKEMPARKQSDAADREKLRERLTTCIDPLNPDDHPNHLVNVVSGKLPQRLLMLIQLPVLGRK